MPPNVSPSTVALQKFAPSASQSRVIHWSTRAPFGSRKGQKGGPSGSDGPPPLGSRLLLDHADRDDLAVLHLVAVDGKLGELSGLVPLEGLADALGVVVLDPVLQLGAVGVAGVDAREEHGRGVVALDRVGAGIDTLRHLLV